MQRGMIDPMCSMHRTQQPRTETVKQNHRARLAAGQNHEDDREIRVAFLRVPIELSARPEPRSIWDEVARQTCPSAPWRYVQRPMRSAARAGADIDRLADFYVALFIDALGAAPKPVRFDVAAAGITAIREQSEALEWQARSLATQCASDSERSARETREAIGANHFYLAALRRARLTGRIG